MGKEEEEEEGKEEEEEKEKETRQFTARLFVPWNKKEALSLA